MRRIRFIAVLFAALTFFGACAEDEPTVSEPEETTEATDEASESESPDDEATVAVAESDLGEILVDGDGKTLYLFTADTDENSTCVDACAETWPPLTVDGEPAAGEGAHEDMLGTTERDDGDTQVTYNGHPLYYYSGDTEDGDTNGQGIGGKWYVVSPMGEAIMDEDAAEGDE